MNCKKLQEARFRGMYEQKEIAVMLGINPSAYCRKEGGNRMWTLREGIMLSSFFGFGYHQMNEVVFDGQLPPGAFFYGWEDVVAVPPKDPRSLTWELQAARARLRLTQKQAADRIGMSCMTYMRKENRQRDWLIEDVPKVTKLLELTYDQMNAVFFGSQLPAGRFLPAEEQ